MTFYMYCIHVFVSDTEVHSHYVDVDISLTFEIFSNY